MKNTLLIFGLLWALSASGQIYINSYRFPAAAGIPAWDKQPYTTTDAADWLAYVATNFTALQTYSQALVGATLLAGTKWAGGVLAPNGKIYGIPFDALQVLEFDPATNTSTLVGTTISGANKYFGGVLAPNGKIYGIPTNSTQVLEFDPATNTSTLVGTTLSGSEKYYGGVLGLNGKIYGIPAASTQVLELLSAVSGLDANAILSRHLNKF